MSIKDLGLAMNEYEKKFGDMPPIFGYPEDEILVAINKALDTGTEMPGWDKVIEKELNITKGTIII